MKYEFIKVDEDTSKLKYKDKEYTFKVTVGLIKEMQGIIKQARIKALQDLTQKGQSIKDFTIEKKVNGKTYYDNSNRKELESIYQEEALLDFYDKKCNEIFNMDLITLLQDIGLETEEEGAVFSKQLMEHLSGNIPRE